MRFGDRAFAKAGYAVFRIDFSLHGERRDPDFRKFDLRKPFPFTTRNAIVQTVFDLRRAVDFLQSRPEIDSTRIGFMGISLGGITGTIFCGVEPRIKVPVLALAGGGFHLLFGFKMLSPTIQNLLAPIEPLNFVGRISPRPTLFINASKDEVIPPRLAKKLQNAAGAPKKVVWFATRHRQIPLDAAFQKATAWFGRYL
jgi:predicted esterase